MVSPRRALVSAPGRAASVAEGSVEKTGLTFAASRGY